MNESVSKAPVERVRITAIQVGARRRKKITRLAGLKKSIEAHGLIHPILVRNGNELVAGQRRLQACTELEWKTIPARRVDELTDGELRAIELEENTQRQDLLDYETSRQRLAEIRQEQASAKTRPTVGQVSRGRRGPARKPGSQRDIAARTGISMAEQDRLEKHVELAEKHPFMQAPGWVQGTVLRAGKELEKLPEAEHEGVAALVDEPGADPAKTIQMLRNVAGMDPEDRQDIYRMARDPDPHVQSRATTTALAIEHEPDPGCRTWIVRTGNSVGPPRNAA